MKNKHNKKRNTAFVFEALLREMAKSIIAKDRAKKQNVLKILKEHFSKGNILEKELQCYRALVNESSMDSYTAEKLIYRAKAQYYKLDKEQIFEAQSQIISKINKEISPDVFSNFVPNYKSFATIAQIFNDKTPLKKRVIMEQHVLGVLSADPKKKNKTLVPVDSIAVTGFVEKFNKTYSVLLPEQRNLLSRYVHSFGENNADFRIIVGNELKRIHSAVEESLTMEEVLSDKDMTQSTKKVLKEIESLNVSNIGEKELKKILKLQNLVNEYKNDASQN
jgi:hypothetical protein